MLFYPNEILATDCLQPDLAVSKETILSPDFIATIDKLVKEMNYHEGLGIAANQEGLLLPVFIVKRPDAPLIAINPTLHLLINPYEVEEACLSLPGISAKVIRIQHVNLIYTNMEGEVRGEVLDGKEAHAVQHEMDHLRGKLYWDNLSRLKREMLRKRYFKINNIKPKRR